MGNDFKKVRPGDKLRIPAAAYNAFIDAANEARRKRLSVGRQAQPESRDRCIVLVKNASGVDVPRGGVLGIDGVVFAPSDNLDGFHEKPCLTGATPTAGTHEGSFVVAVEPIADGLIGRAAVAGACIAMVEMADPDHRFADITDGDSAKLTSAADGGARILYVEPASPGGGGMWALVRLGDGAGDPLPVPTAQYQVLQCTAFTDPNDYTVAFDWVRAHPSAP